MKLAIIGQDTLAAATRTCSERFFILVDPLEAEVIWVCYDTPIKVDGSPDVNWTLEQIHSALQGITQSRCIVVSSQLPVGTTYRLERLHPLHRWVHSPENIRVASAIADFQNQARIIVGRRTENDDGLLTMLFGVFTEQIIFTDPETAEMSKHALNCWLGMNIAFINEIARLCLHVGGDADVITKSLRMDSRVGDRAPLQAGPPFGGGHLARDITTVSRLCAERRVHAPIIANILKSNEGEP